MEETKLVKRKESVAIDGLMGLNNYIGSCVVLGVGTEPRLLIIIVGTCGQFRNLSILNYLFSNFWWGSGTLLAPPCIRL